MSVWAANCVSLESAKPVRVSERGVQLGDAGVSFTSRSGGAAAGADVRIVAHGAGRASPYVANCTLDGKVLATPFLEHGDLVAGHTLEFWMAPHPTRFWLDE